jgi:hypothetical protein
MHPFTFRIFLQSSLHSYEEYIQLAPIRKSRPKCILRRLKIMLCIQAFMIPYYIIPFYKICKTLEFHSLFFVQIVPFFDLSVSLRMFNPCFNVLYAMLFQERLESAFTLAMFVFLIRIILATPIGYYLFYLSDPAIPDSAHPSQY